MMSTPLKVLLVATDVLFLLYWALSALNAAGTIELPAALMYPHADDPRVVAWNWSFLPIDIAFSVTGLWAAAAARRGNGVWRPLALISLILTMTAGVMAIAYWMLAREIDWSWWFANAALVIWPIPFLPRLVRDMAGAQ